MVYELQTPYNSWSKDFHNRNVNVWTAVDLGAHTFRATLPAKLDKITEVGITCTPLIKGGYSSTGKAAAGVLARFQLKGNPGGVMSFEPGVAIKTDISSFIGQDVDNLRFGLVDQNGDPVNDIQGEHWSAIMVVEYDI